VPWSPSTFNDEVATLDVAQLTEALAKGIPEKWIIRALPIAEIANPINLWCRWRCGD